MSIKLSMVAAKSLAIILLTMNIFIEQIESTKSEDGETKANTENTDLMGTAEPDQMATVAGQPVPDAELEHPKSSHARGKQIATHHSPPPPSSIDKEAQRPATLATVIEQLASLDEPSSSKSTEDEQFVAGREGEGTAQGEDADADDARHFVEDERHDNDRASDDEPPDARSMQEVFEEISKAREASTSKMQQENVVVAGGKLTAQQSITKSMLDSVVAQIEEMRKHQAVVKVYELLNTQAKIVNTLMENEDERRTLMGPVDEYFTKFKQFMEHMEDNGTAMGRNGNRLAGILKRIEGPRERVQFGEEIAAIENIGEYMGHLGQEFQDKNAVIAERTETISEGVQSVMEFQLGQNEKKEFVYLSKVKRNVSLPLKMVTECFGKLELAMAYLTHVHDIIKNADLLRRSSFPRYFIRVEARLTLITGGISLIRRQVAAKLHFSGHPTHIAGPIGQNFMQKVLEDELLGNMKEIKRMATLEGTSIIKEQVLFLCFSSFVQRAQVLLIGVQTQLRHIDHDSELINAVALMIKSADALAKLRRNILSLDKEQQTDE